MELFKGILARRRETCIRQIVRDIHSSFFVKKKTYCAKANTKLTEMKLEK